MKMRIMPKKTSKILSLALALALLAFYVPANVTASAEADHPFEGGDGWTTPYGISTVAQLAAMGDYPNTSFILLNDITVSTYSGGKNGVVETLEGVEFDGNGYTISGIRSYQGLFAETEGSTIIKNLNVAASITNSGEDHVGAIVGYAHDYLQIINCHGSGTVRSDTGYGVGGLVGSMYGSDVLDIIQSSFNGTVQGQYEVGGLVGKTDYAYIYQCRTSGSVTAIGGSTRYGNDAGGLVGDFQGTMQQCFSSATIVGETNVGGLVGTFGPGANRPVMVKDSYSTGRVTGYGTNVGGIAGHMQPTAGDADIDNCYSTSTLTGNANVGGIVGNSGSRSWVTDCYAINTSLTITSRNSMFGRVTGEASALCSNIYGKTNLRMSNTDGDTVGNGHDGDDMSLTQLQSQSSYYGWNFSSIWKMNPYYSSYPTLQWQEENQQSVALNETAITIRVGESFPLTASTIPDSASVTWSVPAQDNITLSSTSGNAITITALKVGEVPVTARIAYASTVCVVTVIPSFSIEPETLTLYEDGDVGTITATMHVPADEIIGCISNNTTVADVSIAPTGEPGIYEITVTSGTVGSAKIIFTSALGCVVECEVNVVIYPPDAIRFSIVPDSDGYFTSIVDSPVQMTIIIDDAAGRVKNKVVELTSSDPSITTIIQSPTNPLTYRVTFSAVVDHVTLTATHESGVSASLNFEVIGDIWR